MDLEQSAREKFFNDEAYQKSCENSEYPIGSKNNDEKNILSLSKSCSNSIDNDNVIFLSSDQSSKKYAKSTNLENNKRLRSPKKQGN